MTEGPTCQYCFKYQHKNTQGEDTADYKDVDRSMKCMEGRVHDDDKKEAARVICRAAFAHNSKNVIGAPMANYLVRNGSRFYFSHSFVYCPLNDIIKIHNRESVDGVAKYCQDTGNMYFENLALHYLCRPEELEHLSVKEFYEKYDVVVYTKKAEAAAKKRGAKKSKKGKKKDGKETKEE